MTTNLNQVPYLPRQLNFPSVQEELISVLDKMYIDIASRVNERTIGLFTVNTPVVIGDQWYIQGQPKKQQALRQVYRITGPGSYVHGINTTQIDTFTRIYGTGYDGTNWFPLPYVDVTAANNQISLLVTPTDIVVTAGAGTPPTIVSGFVILEWISKIN